MATNLITPELIQELAHTLHDSTRLISPDSAEYEKAIKRWSDTAIKRAGVVAYPLSATEVSKLVVFASKHALDLAVKGGGHSTGGTSSSDGGLVIDLSQMRTVTVDAENKIITAQGGALWEDVDTAAAEYSLATVGGTVSHTGIGGLTLGGGFGWLSGQYGPVVDSLIGATVVTPDGQILEASESENADLFWAIRGAGHNFGVTVEFRYRAYDQPNPVYAGSLVFTPDKLDALVEIFNSHFLTKSIPQAAFWCVFANPPGAPGPVVMVVLFYNGNEEAGKKHFSAFFDLGPVMTNMASMPYAKVNQLMNEMSQHGGRKALKGGIFAPPLRKEFVRWLFNEYVSKITTEPDLNQTFLGIEFYDMNKTTSVPVEAMAFPTRGLYHGGIFGLYWSDPSKDDEARAWGRHLQKKCREEIRETRHQPGSTTILEYANYSEPGDVVDETPFGANQTRLTQLKAKYDPKNLFHKTNPITPAS